MKKHGETRKNTVFDGKLMAANTGKGEGTRPSPIFCRGAEFTAVSKARDNVCLHGTICTKVVGASVVVVSKCSAHLEKQICRYNS